MKTPNMLGVTKRVLAGLAVLVLVGVVVAFAGPSFVMTP